VPPPSAALEPRPRATFAGDRRPQVDPACAGCPQLVLLRALRRAGVPASGRLSCEPGTAPSLAVAERGRARLVVWAGPHEPDPVAAAGVRGAPVLLERVAPGGAAEVEDALARALGRPGTTWLVAVAPCPAGHGRAAPLRVVEARCNRCGGCLSLACPAIRDEGGESMSIDRATCVGCLRCAPLCRGRALVG
jgi:Pyruvate/2-oxoacid:ferredoxin oxidoreductase delta subunit